MAESDSYRVVRNTSIMVNAAKVEDLIRAYVQSLGLPGVPKDPADIAVSATSDGRLTAIAKYVEE